MSNLFIHYVIRKYEHIFIYFSFTIYWYPKLVLAEKEKDNKDVYSFFPEVKSVLKEIKLDDVTLESSPTTVYNEQERNEGKLHHN